MPHQCTRGDCTRPVSLKDVTFDTGDGEVRETYECSAEHRFTVKPMEEMA